MTDVLIVVFIVALVFAWQVIGVATVALIRPDLLEETKAAIVNTWLWPAGLVTNLVVWPIVKRRRERARQARITAKVAAGDYDAEFARRQLRWKG